MHCRSGLPQRRSRHAAPVRYVVVCHACPTTPRSRRRSWCTARSGVQAQRHPCPPMLTVVAQEGHAALVLHHRLHVGLSLGLEARASGQAAVVRIGGIDLGPSRTGVCVCTTQRPWVSCKSSEGCSCCDSACGSTPPLPAQRPRLRITAAGPSFAATLTRSMPRRAWAASRVFLKCTRRSDPRACKQTRQARGVLNAGGPVLCCTLEVLLRPTHHWWSWQRCPGCGLVRIGPRSSRRLAATAGACRCRPAAASRRALLAPPRCTAGCACPEAASGRGGGPPAATSTLLPPHMPRGCSRRLQRPGALLTAVHAVQGRLAGPQGLAGCRGCSHAPGSAPPGLPSACWLSRGRVLCPGPLPAPPAPPTLAAFGSATSFAYFTMVLRVGRDPRGRWRRGRGVCGRPERPAGAAAPWHGGAHSAPSRLLPLSSACL